MVVGPVEVADLQMRERREQREPGVVRRPSDQLGRGLAKPRVRAVPEQVHAVPAQQVDQRGGVTPPDGVAERIAGSAPCGERLRGPSVQIRDDVRTPSPQLDLQVGTQQRLEGVAGAAGTGRDDQPGRPLDPVQHLARVGALREGLRERGRDLRTEADRLHERTLGRLHPLHDLVDQVVRRGPVRRR